MDCDDYGRCDLHVSFTDDDLHLAEIIVRT